MIQVFFSDFWIIHLLAMYSQLWLREHETGSTSSSINQIINMQKVIRTYDMKKAEESNFRNWISSKLEIRTPDAIPTPPFFCSFISFKLPPIFFE